MSYKPEPIDTSHVKLPPELMNLSEMLARNTHEIWAQQRLADGWHYGKRRDDVRKEHPCIVPYEELPESEKVYDRETAMGALKAIVELGYQVKKASRRRNGSKRQR